MFAGEATSDPTPPEPESILDEQLAYYGAIASTYHRYAIRGALGADVVQALDAFGPTGDVLELACGPGTWTPQLLRHATRVTALDGSSAMLARAASRVTGHRVRFIEADIFKWTPDRHYDVVFFGFWLSHVPEGCFEPFWSLVASCLKPQGRVFFVDDARRTPDELIYGDESAVVRRRLQDGAAYRVVKVPHIPASLERRLRDLGWRIAVRSAAPPFFWGAGAPA